MNSCEFMDEARHIPPRCKWDEFILWSWNRNVDEIMCVHG